MNDGGFFASPGFASVVGIASPILFIGGIAVLKKVIRGPGGWHREDFYQGVELCWASSGAALLQYYDTAREVASGARMATSAVGQLAANTLLVIASLFALFIAAAWHQENAQPQTASARRRQVWLLGVVSNVIGAGLIFVFVVFVKGMS